MHSLNDWNIIKLTETSRINIEKDDEVFQNILKGGETRINEKIIRTIFSAMIIDNERTDKYSIVQWTSKPYTL